ncbi:MAG: right-handed parallel beta-helix repeat-containing protein [Thermoguttaceae bacterium]
MAYNPFWMLDGPWFWGQRTSGADPAHGDFGDNLIGYNSAGGYPSYMSATDYATMPSVDCSGSVGTQLSFWRYLGVDASNRAHASIQVHGRMAAHQALAPSASAAADPADQSDDGWVTIWSNPDTALIDDGWVYQEFDISAIADGQSDVQVRFGMGPTNGAKSYCGWNLDDIKISGVQNQAPLLTPAGPALGQTTPQAPLEVALAAFINNGPDTTQIFDPDTTAACGGIAVTGTTGSGTWEYSFDETGFYPVGNVSDGAALLLPASALLRYTPDGEHGETPTITYRGWDTTCGSYGGRLDATSSGGIWPCSAVTDTASLLVRSTPYYVNDGSTANDAWCTAPGNDANDGLSPATPKASVQAILNAYQLLPGDVVWIDTGTYKLTKNIVVGTADGGDAGGRVQFLASPYGVSFQRNSTAPGAYAWQIQASYVTLATEAAISHPEWPQSWMQVTGGFAGVDIASDDLPSGDSGHVTLSRCDTAGNYAAGILVSGKPSQQVLIENCLARNSSQPGGGAGISVEGGATATVQNCTVDGNAAYGIFVSGAPGTQLHNNIVCAEGPNALAISSDGLAASDYNDLYATGGAWVGYWGGYQLTLAEWQTATGLDGDSLSQDPLFADAVGGDLHLMSRSGRYVPATDLWVADTADSPCIDRGDPASDYSLEPPLNGGRINLGAYGNTDQASKTYVQPEVTGMALIQKALTYESTVSYAVTFNEPVSGVDADDFQTVGDLAGRPIVDVWGSGTTWIVSVDAGPGEGSLQLKLVDDDSIVDAGQNPLGGLGAGNGDYTGPACTLDHTPPKVSIEPVVPSLRNTPVEQIVIDFSEPVQGFDLSRLQLCLNGGVDLLLGDGTDPLPPATAPTLTSSDGKTWVLGNLSGLTAAPGGYTLSLTSGGLPVTDLAGNSLTGSPTVQWLLPTAVVGRMVFYNTPQYAPTDPQDVVVYDDAIAPDKTALLPGQTAGFANYTTYTCGINGVMVDLANLCYPPTLDDFQFRLGNSSDPATWAALSTLPAMTVRWAEGLGGSDRISLVWPDGTIVNTWLQVTVKAGLDTGLAADDVFYFGNAVGDTGNLPKGATQVVVDAADEQAVRTHESGFNPVDLANPYDFNRDGQVNATDELIARHNRTGANPLELITAPAAGGKGNAPAAGMGGLTNAGTVTGGLTIEGGTHYFAPNTQNTIAVTASGGAAVEGMNLCVQVGDGGQANGGTNTQPTITALDITGKGTLFSASNTGSSPQQDGPLMWMASTTTDENAAATLPAAGDVALVTIDTKGTAAGQSFPLRLSDVAGSIFAGGIGSDFAGITPSVQDGRLVVVDMAWRPGASGNWWASDWDGGPAKFPDASINAAIDTPATVTIDGPQSVHSLAVAHGGHLVIAANGSLTVGGPLIIGEGGTIEVQAGGTLIVPALDQDSGAGTLLLDGGRLEATASFASSIPIFLDAQGGTVDTAGFNLDLAGSLTGPGGLTKMGLGQLSLDAANYYADRTTVSTGVMEIGGADALPRGTSLTVGGGGGGGGVVLWQVLEPIVLGFGAGAGSPVTPSSISSTADAIVSRVQPAPLSPTAVAATAPAETGVQSAPAAGFQTAATAEPTPVVAPGSAAETTRGPRWVQTVLAAASIKITTDQRAWAKSADMGMPAASKADLSRSHDVVLQFRGVRPSLRDVAWLTAFDELNTRNQSSRKDALPAYATDEVLARYSQQ